MENEKELKQIADEIMAKQGSLKGGAIAAILKYVFKRQGSNGVKLIEDNLENLGYPLKLEEIEDNAFYRNGFSVMILILAKKIFNWTDDDIFEWGNTAPQLSTINRLLARYFVSTKTLAQKSSEHWKKYYDFGEVEIMEFNEAEKRLILRIKDFDFHPITCVYLAGYLKRLVQFTAQEVDIKETDCLHKGGRYHEYEISWK